MDARRDLIGAWQRPQQGVSAGCPFLTERREGDVGMIVLGADMHKRSHSIAAVSDTTGELVAERSAAVGSRGFEALLKWARGLEPDRVWALEDCRHVSGAFERFLIAHGERVVRVAPRLMAGARQSSRQRGKSDQIDALAVARAALREGIDTLPSAELGRPRARGPPARRSPRAAR